MTGYKSALAVLLAAMLQRPQHDRQPVLAHLLLPVRQHPLRQLPKRLIHVRPLPRAHLHVLHPVLLRKPLRLLAGHHALRSEVELGGHEEAYEGVVGSGVDLARPGAEVGEGVGRSEVEGEDDAPCALEVGLRDVAEALLARRVPDLEAHGESVEADVLELEVDADGGHVALLEDALAVLGHEVGLADPAVPDDHHLRQAHLLAPAARHYSILRKNKAHYISQPYIPKWARPLPSRSTHDPPPVKPSTTVLDFSKNNSNQ